MTATTANCEIQYNTTPQLFIKHNYRDRAKHNSECELNTITLNDEDH